MTLPQGVLLFCSERGVVPDCLTEWATRQGLRIEAYSDHEELAALVMRGRGRLVTVVDGPDEPDHISLVKRLKADSFSAIIPVTILCAGHNADRAVAWYEAGADEVLSPLFEMPERIARLDAVMARTERDVAVHPSTRLPGTVEIERAIRSRLDSGAPFAVCYADLDHFKEFNDRYSYYDGDRVILILSRILHDVVRGLQGNQGFVGHIGGDDFICIVPFEAHAVVCTEILNIFDQLIPLQYSDEDRRSGYFFGKDRRGQLHRVPLMTLSIGVVTNRNRPFTHPAQVSELATEMKSYAKTLPGSVFAVDRRRGDLDLRSGPGGKDARSQ